MTSRTDIHRPTELVTEDYTFIYADDNLHPAQNKWAAEMRSIVRRGMTGPTADRGTDQCHHCGAYLRYYAILKHEPTQTYIAVGETCLDNRFGRATAEFQRLRKQAALDRQAQRIKTAAAEFAASLPTPLNEAFDRDTDLAERFGLDGWALSTVTDIRRKVWDYYGNATERQVALVQRLIDEVPVRKARAMQRAAEEAAQIPAPTGKVTFTGTVVSRKWHENDFGGAMKITVKVSTPEGIYLVWVTEPKALGNTEVGDVVNMTATLTQSNDKPHFAFGKRPSKASIVQKNSEGDGPSALD